MIGQYMYWAPARLAHFIGLPQAPKPIPARVWAETGEGEPERTFPPTRNRNAAPKQPPPCGCPQGQGAKFFPNGTVVQITHQPSGPKPGLNLRPDRMWTNNWANKMKPQSTASPNKQHRPLGRQVLAHHRTLVFSRSGAGWRQAESQRDVSRGVSLGTCRNAVFSKVPSKFSVPWIFVCKTENRIQELRLQSWLWG